MLLLRLVLEGNNKTAYGYQWRYISHDGGIIKRDCD